MAENRYESVSNFDYIRDGKYPFEIQKKDQLVYVDLIEHLILHAIIIQKTNGSFGGAGYDAYLTQNETELLFKAINEGPLRKRNKMFEYSKQASHIIFYDLRNEWKYSIVSLFSDNDEVDKLYDQMLNKLTNYPQSIDHAELEAEIRKTFKSFLLSPDEVKERERLSDEEKARKREEIRQANINWHKEQLRARKEWRRENPELAALNLLPDSSRYRIERALYKVKKQRNQLIPANQTFKQFDLSLKSCLYEEILNELKDAEQ